MTVSEDQNIHEQNFERFQSFATDEQVERMRALVAAEAIRRKAKIIQVDGSPGGTSASIRALLLPDERDS